MHGSISKKCPEQAKPRRQKVDQWLPGPGGEGRGASPNRHRASAGRDRNVLTQDSGDAWPMGMCRKRMNCMLELLSPVLHVNHIPIFRTMMKGTSLFIIKLIICIYNYLPRKGPQSTFASLKNTKPFFVSPSQCGTSTVKCREQEYNHLKPRALDSCFCFSLLCPTAHFSTADIILHTISYSDFVLFAYFPMPFASCRHHFPSRWHLPSFAVNHNSSTKDLGSALEVCSDFLLFIVKDEYELTGST